MNKISVLTPTYNRLNHLQELIWMFKEQDYPNKELIILNDNPLIKLTCEVDDVFVYNVPKMNSLGELRNKLIDLSTGEFIHFWDDDDVRDKNALSQLFEAWEVREIGKLAVAFNNYLYFENYHAQKETKGGGNHVFFGLFSKLYTDKFQFDPKLHLGEDQDFVKKGRNTIEVTEPKRSPIAYCWGNDVWHVSGTLINLNNTDEHIERKRLFEQIHEESTEYERFELHPIIKHDYFGEFDKYYENK